MAPLVTIPFIVTSCAVYPNLFINYLRKIAMKILKKNQIQTSSVNFLTLFNSTLSFQIIWQFMAFEKCFESELKFMLYIISCRVIDANLLGTVAQIELS